MDIFLPPTSEGVSSMKGELVSSKLLFIPSNRRAIHLFPVLRSSLKNMTPGAELPLDRICFYRSEKTIAFISAFGSRIMEYYRESGKLKPASDSPHAPLLKSEEIRRTGRTI